MNSQTGWPEEAGTTVPHLRKNDRIESRTAQDRWKQSRRAIDDRQKDDISVALSTSFFVGQFNRSDSTVSDDQSQRGQALPGCSTTMTAGVTKKLKPWITHAAESICPQLNRFNCGPSEKALHCIPLRPRDVSQAECLPVQLPSRSKPHLSKLRDARQDQDGPKPGQ